MQKEGILMKDGKVNMSVLQREKTICLLCCEAVSIVKEYNIRRHFDTRHGAKYAKFSPQEKKLIVQELKGKLQPQQDRFTKATAQSDAAVNSFIVA